MHKTLVLLYTNDSHSDDDHTRHNARGDDGGEEHSADRVGHSSLKGGAGAELVGRKITIIVGSVWS